MEKTLVLIKPDAMERGIAGRIISRFEEKGLKLAGMKMMRTDERLLEEHYAHLKDKPFFPRIKAFMTSTPIIAICIEGLDAVDVVRKICGVTNSREALMGTIRGDWGMSIQSNLVHASDSKESAAVEVSRFFSDKEVFSYPRMLEEIIYAPDER
ncbi:MAG: nucleoside-diphosphate kinase [Thermodesulfobacteriota bacterium]|nr:nucleoside-diphosphate kinase [Thermodesulfobacteriota bacterium]